MRTVTNLEELVEGFRLYCLAEGKARKTIGWYIPKLVLLKEYLEEKGLPIDVFNTSIGLNPCTPTSRLSF